MEYSDQINKEFYKAQLECAANNLLSRIDDILEDWDKGIANIHIEVDINPASFAMLKVTKEYGVREVYKECVK